MKHVPYSVPFMKHVPYSVPFVKHVPYLNVLCVLSLAEGGLRIPLVYPKHEIQPLDPRP